MASELRVDKIIPSSGASIGIGTTNGTTTVVNNLSVGSSVTANAFYGDGSGLTGAGPTLANGADNRVITATGANAIQGEANLTFDGDTLLLKSSTDGRRVSFAGDGTSHYMKYDNTLGGIILNGYGGIAFETNGTNERFRITSTGNFGLATSSPVAQTTSGSVALTPVLDLKGTGSLANASGVLQFTRKDNATQGSCIYSAGEDAGLTFRNTDGNGFGFYNGTTINLRLAANGTLNNTGSNSAPNGNANGWGFTQDQLYLSTNNSSANYALRFYNSNGLVGSVLVNGSGVTYNTSSDYRLKENQVSISDGITRLKQLKPYKFNYKADPTTVLDGFFAHEAQSVVPQSVAGVKDGVESADDEIRNVKAGDPIYQGIDHSALVPLLTAALQEAITKIETLESKVAALESS
tara:strand:- start:42 stop:1265 length:1224 start_codon:yes stop_codon:yes gene_type:complete